MEWEVHLMQWPITMEMLLALEIVIMIIVVVTVLQRMEVDGGTMPVMLLTSMVNTDHQAQVVLLTNQLGELLYLGLFTSLKFK